jgi:hypothetical protein
MNTLRSIRPHDPLLFGRRVRAAPDFPGQAAPASIGEDLRLFVMTFAAGFLFVSIFLG